MNELKYLENLNIFEIKLGLKNIKKFSEHIKNPHKKYKTIHVAGTNGKGSTATFISEILKKKGFKVGLYTSPHLVKFNERIKINGKNISNKDLKKEIIFLKKIREKNNLKTTFFEFTTLIAFNYFARKKIDYAVIEVGLGGRFDATNIINPQICAITNISKDHQEILGNSLEKIAFEKAGIIKKNKTILTTENKKICIKVFKRISRKKRAKLKQIKNFEKLKLKMKGKHQQKNANLAKQIIKELNLGISDEIINQALFETKIKGRYEVINEKPKIIIDSSHNKEGIKTLEKLIKNEKNKKILLIGLSKDKPISMIKNIAKEFDEVVISRSDFKPQSIENILKDLWQYNQNSIGFDKLSEAKKYTIKKLNKNDTMIVTGSIYFIGNYLKLK